MAGVERPGNFSGAKISIPRNGSDESAGVHHLPGRLWEAGANDSKTGRVIQAPRGKQIVYLSWEFPIMVSGGKLTLLDCS